MLQQKKYTKPQKINEQEISNKPVREFRVMIMKTLTRLQRRLDELCENFNKEIENMKKNQSELKTITEMENIPEGINRFEDGKEHISNLEDWVMESTQPE